MSLSHSGMKEQKVVILCFLACLLLALISVPSALGASTPNSNSNSNFNPLSLGSFSSERGQYDGNGSPSEGVVSRAMRALATPRAFGLLSLLFIIAPILALIALPLLVILAFVPVAVAPAGRAMVAKLFPRGLDATSNNFILDGLGQMIETEDCVERISCHIFQATGQYGMFEKVFSLLKMLPKNSSLTKRIVRGTTTKKSCISFKCSSFKKFWSSIHEQQSTDSTVPKMKSRSD